MEISLANCDCSAQIANRAKALPDTLCRAAATVCIGNILYTCSSNSASRMGSTSCSPAIHNVQLHAARQRRRQAIASDQGPALRERPAAYANRGRRLKHGLFV